MQKVYKGVTFSGKVLHFWIVELFSFPPLNILKDSSSEAAFWQIPLKTRIP